MNENTEIGIHTEKSSETTLIRSIETMAKQLSKFTFENKTAADKMIAFEKQALDYRMNLKQLRQKINKLDDQIDRASPIITRMQDDHEICNEQYQEAKKQMLIFQLSVDNEENKIHNLQNKMEMQKRRIQSIIKRIGKMRTGLKAQESAIKSIKSKERMKKGSRSNLMKSQNDDERMTIPVKTSRHTNVQKMTCGKDCPFGNSVKTKQRNNIRFTKLNHRITHSVYCK